MRAPAWIRRALARPIGESERRAAFTAITVVLIAACVLLTMTSTGVSATKPSREARQPTRTIAPVEHGAAVSAEALRTARRFLDGYLAFAYGHGPASAVKDTTSSFAAALSDRARVVPPVLRRLHPRLVALRTTSSTGAGVVVTGLVKDGEVVAYPIRVQLAARAGRYLVTGLAGA